jgi:hypothetical protein
VRIISPTSRTLQFQFTCPDEGDMLAEQLVDRLPWAAAACDGMQVLLVA